MKESSKEVLAGIIFLVWLAVLTMSAGLVAGLVIGDCTADKVGYRGGDGQACYPNSTCLGAAKCWVEGDHRRCRIKPPFEASP